MFQLRRSLVSLSRTESILTQSRREAKITTNPAGAGRIDTNARTHLQKETKVAKDVGRKRRKKAEAGKEPLGNFLRLFAFFVANPVSVSAPHRQSVSTSVIRG